jgi:hypothetical protein
MAPDLDAPTIVDGPTAEVRMDVKDYLPILFERSNTAQSLWNFEAVVVLGIIGFLATAGSKANQSWLLLLIIIVFLGFVYFNLSEILKVSHQRETLANAVIPSLADERLSDLRKYLNPNPRVLVVALHVVVDIATVFAIWIIPKMIT